MKAITKAKAAPGADFIDVPEPQLVPGSVRVRVRHGSVCGTDLHIYKWDKWAAGRIQPPRIIGHEFSGYIEEVGEGVTGLAPGDFVASESHITCGKCKQCLNNQRHVCINTRILGVDVDGGFAPYAVIPALNARKTDVRIPPEVACVQDPLGNAVHTVNAGAVEGQDILITGMGPIGLFAVGICKTLGAKSVAVTEVSPLRLSIAEAMGADLLINPIKEDATTLLCRKYPLGLDATLEMSGHPSALELGIRSTRPGGRLSILGLFPDDTVNLRLNEAIFKGLEIQCIVGRKLWETWEQMAELLSNDKFDISPVLTHRFHYSQFDEAMELIQRGETGKVVFDID